MKENGISIEYNLKGLYTEKEEDESKFSEEDRIELLRLANMHKQIGTAKVKKGIYVTIKEAVEKIFNSNKNKLALGEGTEKTKKEETEHEDIRTKYKVKEGIKGQILDKLSKIGNKKVDKEKSEEQER